VLVMRDTTERPEGVEAGTARLVGTERATIVTAVRTLLHDQCAYAGMANAVNPYGDGRAASRVVAALAHFFGDGPPAEPFVPRAAERNHVALRYADAATEALRRQPA
jgi:UDP-N-acetylglucosamine 2-epimerase (non-hydrolysing)